MSDRATEDRVDAELGRALATHAASRERVYYDADADASGRAAYYAVIDEREPSEQLFHSLGVLLEHTHAPRLSYKPAERVYPWVDLHPDGRLRSIYSGKPFDAEEFIRADAEIARRRAVRLQELTRRESTLGPREFEAAFDALMWVSAETIYQSLYVQSRGCPQARADALPAHRPGAAQARPPGRPAQEPDPRHGQHRDWKQIHVDGDMECDSGCA